MIAIQTKALLVDAYRDLNARKLFWIVLILNVIVVGGFALLGVKDNRLSLLNWQMPQDGPPAMLLYKWVFSYVIVGRWLTWVATLLALISTASIFPDFLTGGAIDLYLSKPIGRLRLFFTKYITGLLFVALQVTVFTVGSFLVLGLRAGAWEPGLFLAIPIVVLFFSYLFSICVLLGVVTRSTLAAFFLTLVAWFLIWGVNTSDRFLMQIDDVYQRNAERAERRVTYLDGQITAIQKRMESAATRPVAVVEPASTTAPATAPAAGDSLDARQLRRLIAQRDRAAAEAAARRPPPWTRTAQQVVFALNTLVPKTQDTIGLLDRALFSDAVLQSALTTTPTDSGPMRGWRRNITALLRGRSMAWILGSSLAFEALVLAVASRRFCRSDY